MYRVQYKYRRTFIGSIPQDTDLSESLNKIVIEEDIRVGQVKAIGAVTEAVVGYFNQTTNAYESTKLSGGHEIVSLIGNLSIKEKKPFVHAHITLSDKDGKVFGGHLMPGTKVFACEVIIDEYTGEDLVREKEQTTGLFLWKNKDLI
jgi:predicted DNA-binding protein with PD1-like motif